MRNSSKIAYFGDENGSNFDPRTIDHSINEYINRPFEEKEVLEQIKKLKNNKASGIDQVINEFIKNSPENMVHLIVKMFNIVLETGIIPTDWTIGLIKPIHKKGSTDDPDNYRGITLLSCIGKCFTAIINTCLTKYLDCVGIIGEEQAGFRHGYSTLDHIFVFHSILSIYLHKKRKVYVAFIDYKKAFDLIDRSSLWSKLIASSINGKIIRVIYNMYDNAKSCVVNDSMYSEFFGCNIGVRQGENLSPLLFAIYLNDFDLFISRRYEGLKDLSVDIKTFLSDDDVEIFLRIFSLLYADDTIVMAETERELQAALNAVFDYCKTWHLTVNTSKTKIVIFSRGKVRKYPDFQFGDSILQVVSEYVYLGTMFNYNNRFHKNKQKQVSLARRAMFGLISRASKLDLPLDIQVELFEQLVTPILLYGSEIWGHEDLSCIEVFYMKFCKLILGLNKNTANLKACRELGKHTFTKAVESRMLNIGVKI